MFGRKQGFGIRLKRVRVGADHTVAQGDDPVGVKLGELRIVCDHDDKAFFGNFLQQVHDLNTGVGIERAGRLIGKQNFRVIDKSAGDGDTLHLTAGHLARPLVELFSKTDLIKCRDCFFAPHLFGNTGNGKRQLYVCKDGLVRDQVVALEDKADRVVPVGIPVAVLILFRGNAVDDQIAAVVAVEAADDIQKRRLSRTARP